MIKAKSNRIYPLLIFVVSVFSSPLFATSVDNIRLWPAPDHTRFVLDMSGPVEHSFHTWNGSLIIDLENASLRADLNSVDLSNTPIKKIRTGSNGNRLRVVLDMNEAVDTNIFSLGKMENKPDRVVLDLLYRGERAKPQVVLEDPMTDGRRDIVIAIVAGHGGELPGAVGPNGVLEKDITLKISQNLERVINATPGYQAVMVRKGDYGVGLRQRREIARQNRADLFLSIHADGFKDRRASGASVYALNMNGTLATSETARYLAERENEADLIGGVGNGVSIKNMPVDVATTLMNLSQTAALNESLTAGQYILDALGGVAKLHKKNVEQAQFVVLQSPDMPSLLIETGFISNPEEERRLNTLAYRRKIADSIFAGVKNYFNSHTPPGTYVAWQKQNGGIRESEHVVARGETLSGIALRYRVSVGDLMSFNQLRDTNIRFGQTLKIPST